MRPAWFDELMPVVAPSPSEQIVRAAERLFAERGVDGVSLRQIGAAAGNGNHSAVQYHFGSKERLVQAIFDFRLPRLHERRNFLIAERRPDTLRSWVECQLRAVLEQSELDGSFYMSFVAMLYQQGRRDAFQAVPVEVRASMSGFLERLRSLLPHIDEPLRSHRIAHAMGLIVHAAADRERARVDSHSVLPFAVELEGLVDGMVGFLKAPASRAALAAVAGADPATVTAPMFL